VGEPGGTEALLGVDEPAVAFAEQVLLGDANAVVADLRVRDPAPCIGSVIENPDRSSPAIRGSR